MSRRGNTQKAIGGWGKETSNWDTYSLMGTLLLAVLQGAAGSPLHPKEHWASRRTRADLVPKDLAPKDLAHKVLVHKAPVHKARLLEILS